MLNQYQPLFLKYRPQALNELVGQSQVVIALTNAIKYDRISHAYLFTGPRGTGKTSSARIFAKSLNCQLGPTISPCQTCTACLEIKQGISPAVFEIDAASNNSVDDARLLIERAPLSACGGRFKLYIIDECHMLTKEAFNALLKTIEEPPANVIFILATTEEHKVPATIVSRCQKLLFRLINEEALGLHLSQIADKENIAIETDAITAIARRAAGGLRDALSLLDQVSLLGLDGQAVSTQDVLLLTGALPEDMLINISRHILQKEGKETLLLLEELLQEGREAHLIAAELAKHMLNIAKAAHRQKQGDRNDLNNIAGSSTYKQSLLELSSLINPVQLVQMIEELDRLEVSCRRSSQPVMNLEIGLLSLCHRLDIIEWQSIQARLDKLEDAFIIAEKKVVSEPSAQTNAQQGYSKARGRSNEMIGRAEQNLDKPEQAIKEVNAPAENHTDQEEEKLMPSKQGISEKKELPAGSVVNATLDDLWQNILSELQKRHLPTFSLLSTHACPVSLIDQILTIGVFVEHFQKMLENKIEFIKAAASACHSHADLRIRINLLSESGQAHAVQSKKVGWIRSEEDKDSELEVKNSPALSLRREMAQRDLLTSSATEKGGQTALTEAYRLFEGPGSRFIVPD